jgi:hypothetical protein
VLFRSWLCTVRPDIDFAVKELSRAVQLPTEEDLAKMKHLLRYLKKTKHLSLQLKPTHTLSNYQTAAIEINSYGDTVWAGCRMTRKSTTGCVVQVLGCTVMHCSRAQATVALSFCEAECYGTGTALSEGLFTKSLILETGLGRPQLSTYTDSSSGKQFSLKSGLSPKLKHVQIRLLWIQDCFNANDSKLCKIHTSLNLGDLGTKYLGTEQLNKLIALCGMVDTVNVNMIF